MVDTCEFVRSHLYIYDLLTLHWWLGMDLFSKNHIKRIYLHRNQTVQIYKTQLSYNSNFLSQDQFGLTGFLIIWTYIKEEVLLDLDCCETVFYNNNKNIVFEKIIFDDIWVQRSSVAKHYNGF